MSEQVADLAPGPLIPASVRPKVILVALFLIGLGFGSGALQWVAYGAVQGFEALARAQYRLHLASQNVNEAGDAEYAVFLGGDNSVQALEGWAEQLPRATLRASSLPGWMIVGLPQDGADAHVSDLRDQPFARAVIRNRGIWICH